MRTQFINSNDFDEKFASEPIDSLPTIMDCLLIFAPWAAEIHAVDGGWMAWESAAEYQTWARQL